MAKKFRLASSRRTERQKIDKAVEMAARGNASPHGRRQNARAILHREIEAPFIPIKGPYDPEWTERPSQKRRHGRHHPPPSRPGSASTSRSSRSMVVRESRPLVKTSAGRK